MVSIASPKEQNQTAASFGNDGTSMGEYLPRKEVVREIMGLTRQKQCVIVTAPPATGKTTLLQLVEKEVCKNGGSAKHLFLMRNKTKADVQWELGQCGIQLWEKIDESIQDMWLLIDNAQDWCQKEHWPFWQFLIHFLLPKSVGRCFIIIAGSYEVTCPNTHRQFASLTHFRDQELWISQNETEQLLASHARKWEGMDLHWPLLKEMSKVADDQYHIGVIVQGILFLQETSRSKSRSNSKRFDSFLSTCFYLPENLPEEGHSKLEEILLCNNGSFFDEPVLGPFIRSGLLSPAKMKFCCKAALSFYNRNCSPRRFPQFSDYIKDFERLSVDSPLSERLQNNSKHDKIHRKKLGSSDVVVVPSGSVEEDEMADIARLQGELDRIKNNVLRKRSSGMLQDTESELETREDDYDDMVEASTNWPENVRHRNKKKRQSTNPPPEHRLLEDKDMVFTKPSPEAAKTPSYHCVVCYQNILHIGDKTKYQIRQIGNQGMLRCVRSIMSHNRNTNPYYFLLKAHIKKSNCKLWCVLATRQWNTLWTPFTYAVYTLGLFYDGKWGDEDLNLTIEDAMSHSTIIRKLQYRFDYAKERLKDASKAVKNFRLTDAKGMAKIKDHEGQKYNANVRNAFFPRCKEEMDKLEHRFLTVDYSKIVVRVTVARFINDVNLAMSDFNFTDKFFEQYFGEIEEEATPVTSRYNEDKKKAFSLVSSSKRSQRKNPPTISLVDSDEEYDIEVPGSDSSGRNETAPLLVASLSPKVRSSTGLPKRGTNSMTSTLFSEEAYLKACQKASRNLNCSGAENDSEPINYSGLELYHSLLRWKKSFPRERGPGQSWFDHLKDCLSESENRNFEAPTNRNLSSTLLVYLEITFFGKISKSRRQELGDLQVETQQASSFQLGQALEAYCNTQETLQMKVCFENYYEIFSGCKPRSQPEYPFLIVVDLLFDMQQHGDEDIHHLALFHPPSGVLFPTFDYKYVRLGEAVRNNAKERNARLLRRNLTFYINPEGDRNKRTAIYHGDISFLPMWYVYCTMPKNSKSIGAECTEPKISRKEPPKDQAEQIIFRKQNSVR